MYHSGPEPPPNNDRSVLKPTPSESATNSMGAPIEKATVATAMFGAKAKRRITSATASLGVSRTSVTTIRSRITKIRAAAVAATAAETSIVAPATTPSRTTAGAHLLVHAGERVETPARPPPAAPE